MQKRTSLLVIFALFVIAGVVGYRYLFPPSAPIAESGSVWFEDITDASGVDFVHDSGPLVDYWLPRINGSGVAVFDFDGDGRLDLYFLTLGGPQSKSVNRLYRNLGGGKFRDVTAGSGLGFAGHNTGVIVGDVDNDGRPDVVVTQYNGVKLFRNLGNGTFADVTPNSGLKNPLWATSANLFDYDRDGWLDLVVVNYINYDPTRNCPGVTGGPDYCGPHLFGPTVSKLFRNLGRKADEASGQPRFSDVTLEADLVAAPGPGLGVFCADFNADGWPDMLVANDLKANHLWINQKNGKFREEGLHRGIGLDAMGQAQSGMGIAVGDADNDGLLDVYITHLTSEHNTLWAQGPKPGFFQDRTAKAGLLATGWRATGWGTLMADFDHDGWLDLAAVNGKTQRGTGTPHPALGEHFQMYGERNQLFRNNGTGVFTDISEANPAFCGEPNMARGLACGDLDGDGAVDLVLTTVSGRARVFRNVAPNRGHWLVVRAFDPRLRRDAYCAELRLERGGQPVLLRVINPGDSFQSSSDPRARFGLGVAARYDSIEVRWPDGLVEVFPGGDSDRAIVLNRGEGRAQAEPAAK